VRKSTESHAEGASRGAESSKRKAASGTYAGLFWRLPGFLVDTLVMGMLWAVVSLLGSRAWTSTTSRPLPVTAGVVFMLLVVWLYPSLLESSRWKSTLGKRLFGLRTVDITGRRIGFGRASVRSVARTVSWAVCMAGFLAMLIGRKKQTFHDRIAGTVVVYLPGTSPLTGPLRVLPQSWQAFTRMYSGAFMATLSFLMLSGCAWAVMSFVRPPLVLAQASATVHLALEQVAPLQHYVAREWSAHGAYPKVMSQEVLATVSVPKGVSVRYTPEQGILDVAFEANPHLQGRLISLAPLTVGSTVTWVCRANGISADVLDGRCVRQ
jgi:uncharacterized RDD family membrane protein YckC